MTEAGPAARGPARVTRARILFGLRVLASVTLLWLVLSSVGSREALSRLTAAEPFWILTALLFLALQTLLSAWRWRITAAALGQTLTGRRAVREYWLAQLLNQVLPGGILGDAGRALRTQTGVGLLRAGQAVVVERMSGQFALFGVLLSAVVCTALVPGGLDWPRWWPGGVVLALLCVLLLPGALLGAARLPGRVGRGAGGLAKAFSAALFAPTLWPRQLCLSTLTVGCNIAAFACCARATGTDLGPAAAAALVPLILLAMLIPFAISGWGFREGAAAALWPLLGAPAEAGVAASVLFGLTLLVASLPGLLALLQRGGA
ncbi:MAG: lysylphosphatidylglycerol synthase transmembrane domain-containing protein [Pseudomonadota bacterium]